MKRYTESEPPKEVKTYHWKTCDFPPIHYLVTAYFLEEARRRILFNLEKWKWQDPHKFESHIKQIKNDTPYFIAEFGHVIAVVCGN